MKIITLFVLSTLSLSSFAQMDTSKEFKPPMLLRGLGVSFQKFDGLNSRVANLPQYKTLRDYAATIELGWLNVHKRFVSDMDLIAGSSMSGDRDRKSSTVRYIGAGIDLGYDVIPNKNILLYPMVGIGGQKYQARFFKDNSNRSFDDVLQSSDVQNQIRSVDFTNAFFTYRLGLGFAFQSPMHPGSSIGVRLGYTGSFKEKAWQSSENQDLGNAPKDKLSQFNVSLVMTSLPRLRM